MESSQDHAAAANATSPRKRRRREASGSAETPPASRFRQDVKITLQQGTSGEGTSCVVEDPASGESYAFGEEEYFLCQAMDGYSTGEEIVNRFQRRFGHPISLDGLQKFENSLMEMGLLERLSPGLSGGETSVHAPAAREKPQKEFHWSLGNPERMFNTLLRVIKPVRPLFLLIPWLLIPAAPIAIFLIVRHWDAFSLDLRTLRSGLGYLAHLLITLVLADSARCLVRGTMLAYYGLPSTDGGIRLRFGIIPRFYVETGQYKKLSQAQKIWYLSSNPFMRLVLIVAGTAVWSFFRGSGHSLAGVGVVVAQAGIIGLIFALLPVRNSDGLRLLAIFFNFSPDILRIAGTVLMRTLQRQPLPPSISPSAAWKYFLFGALLIVGWVFFFFKITSVIAKGLAETFPGIFGNATAMLFWLIVVVLMVRWMSGRFLKPQKQQGGQSAPAAVAEDSDDDSTGMADFFRRHSKLAVLAVLAVLAAWPYPYRPGGEIQVLPPVQQQIQAPVSGKIIEVAYVGGDGKLIQKGAQVAKMISSEIENEILTLEQSKTQQIATIDKLKSELAKLQAGARTEEVTGAEAKLQQAVEQTNIAQQELEAAKVTAAYSTMVLPRMVKLYESGSLAFLQFEEAKKTANLDKIAVQKQQKNLASLNKAREEAQSQVDLLRSGARKEDVESAKHEIGAAEAELSQIEQQIHYALQQQTSGALLMPLEGYLVETYLDFKKGTYLRTGDVFATAQNNSQPQVEVQLPEYDMEGVEVGASTAIKLYAYPNTSLFGKVLSIQPAALPSSSQESGEVTSRMFRVLIEVDKAPFELKAGMTGYAKILAGVQPLGLLLIRPLVRFVQIEMWSWMP